MKKHLLMTALAMGVLGTASAQAGILLKTDVSCVVDNATNSRIEKTQTAFQGGGAIEVGNFIFWPRQAGEDKQFLVTNRGSSELVGNVDLGSAIESYVDNTVPDAQGEEHQCSVRMTKVKGKVPMTFLFY